jgi:hypothetical protein
MAISFRSYTAGSSVATTDLVVTVPSGVQDDDLLFLIITTFSVISIPTPSGWTQAGSTQDVGTDSSTGVFYKIASSEGTSWTFTGFWPAATSCRWTSLSYPGVDTTTPLDVAVTQNSSGFTTTPATTSITPSNNNSMIVAMMCCDSGSNPTGTPDTSPACTERVDIASRPTIYVQDYLQSTAAAVVIDGNFSSADTWASFAVALREDSGAAGLSIPVAMNTYRRRR